MLKSRTDPRPGPPAPHAVRPPIFAAWNRLLTGARRWLHNPAPTSPPGLEPADPPLSSGLAAARAAFRLPPRGRYELPATLDQKRALERRGGRDYDLIDSLGYEQADLLLRHLEQEAQTRADLARREANRAKRGHLFAAVLVGLIVVDALILVLIFSQGGTLISQDSVILEPRHAPAPHPPASPSAPPSVISAHPATNAPTPTRSAAFRADVGYSRAAALTQYPDLAVPGSAFNARFVARYQVWRETNDPRLNRSNWPEILAHECAVNTPPAARVGVH